MLRHGLVLDRRSRPVSGATVSVQWGSSPTADVAFATDDAGRFRVALPAGHFRIGAHAPNGLNGSVETVVSASEPAPDDLVIFVGGTP